MLKYRLSFVNYFSKCTIISVGLYDFLYCVFCLSGKCISCSCQNFVRLSKKNEHAAGITTGFFFTASLQQMSDLLVAVEINE